MNKVMGLLRVRAYNKIVVGRRLSRSRYQRSQIIHVEKREADAEAEKAAGLAQAQRCRIGITEQDGTQNSTEWWVESTMKFSVRSSVRPGSTLPIFYKVQKVAGSYGAFRHFR